MPVNRRRLLIALVLLFALAVAIVVVHWLRNRGPRTAPSSSATWPWPHAVMSTPRPGVTMWTDLSSTDGTTLRLIRFDFTVNPKLRFGLLDQSSLTPGSSPQPDTVDYWPMGVAQATAFLNSRHERTVVAACNGLFFDVDRASNPPYGVAHHVAAIVDDGVVKHNVGNYRWTFGAKIDTAGLPAFDVVYLPERLTMARSFTYASGGAQCLIHGGVPLRVASFPAADGLPEISPFPSTPLEAGHVPIIDHIKTSRIGFGWSRDSRQLYLLSVRQGGSEEASIAAFQQRGQGDAVDARRRMLAQGGWDLADEQRFWRKLGVWDAINSDGGEVAQLTVERIDGRYDLLPASWASPTEVDGVDLLNAATANALPEGGSLMYFYIDEIRIGRRRQ